VLLTGLGGKSAARLQEFLFGAITSLSVDDVFLTMSLATVVMVCAIGLSPQLFALAHDQDFARVAGLRVRAYNVLVAVLAALTVAVAMRTVGLLLVSALMVVPVATAQQLTHSFRTTLLAAMAIGAAASVGGLSLSAVLSDRVTVAPGPAIVLLALAGFAATWPLGVWLRYRARLRVPFTEVDDPASPEYAGEHPHVHGPECGHVAVQHGDHVDYVHDGHRHAVHGGHYDEH
jgi:zinc transport system permease protein